MHSGHCCETVIDVEATAAGDKNVTAIETVVFSDIGAVVAASHKIDLAKIAKK
jgi:hypothetical protein